MESVLALQRLIPEQGIPEDVRMFSGGIPTSNLRCSGRHKSVCLTAVEWYRVSRRAIVAHLDRFWYRSSRNRPVPAPASPCWFRGEPKLFRGCPFTGQIAAKRYPSRHCNPFVTAVLQVSYDGTNHFA